MRCDESKVPVAGSKGAVGSAIVTHQRLLGRVVSDSALYGFSAAIAKALALVTVPYLTRALSPAGYGIADLATSSAALLTLIVMFSGDIPAARLHGLAADDPERRRTLSSYVWGTFALAMVVSLALLPLSSIIAGRLWASEDLAGLVALTLILVPVSATQAALTQTLRIQSRPRLFALLSLVDLLAQLGLAVAFVGAGFGPAGVIIGFVVGSAIGLAIAAVACRTTIQVAPGLMLASRLVVRGLPFLPHVTVFVLADWMVRAIVANAIGPEGVAELGLAIRVASVLSLLGAAFAMAWGPIGLARAADPASARLFGRVLTAYGAASVALALMIGAIGPELMPILAGPGFEGAALILPGFALAYALAGTEYVLVVAAGVSERGSRVAFAATLGAAMQVVVAGLLVPSLGLAAIGPVAVLGRLVSFVLLLAGVRSSVLVPVGRLIALGATALLAFGAIQIAIGSAGSWAIERWSLGAGLCVLALVLTARVIRGRTAIVA